MAAEFERSSRGLAFFPLGEPDTYAPEVGFSDGFPVALDPKLGRAWLIHCYGMVGAGRDNDVDSGGGTELYAVIGQAPRHLDRNVTLLGKVVQGMDLLASLPRGTGALGFYEKPEQRLPITSFKVAADVPESQRVPLEELRTDTQTFADYIEARRNRHEEWFKVPAGHVDICNVPVPVCEREGKRQIRHPGTGMCPAATEWQASCAKPLVLHEARWAGHGCDMRHTGAHGCAPRTARMHAQRNADQRY